MRKAPWVTVVVWVCLVALGGSTLQAQVAGSITGIVTDSSGAVVPGVTIEATNVGTNLVRTAVTAGDGRYTVLQVPPGPYEVRAALAGFRTSVREGVTVTLTNVSPHLRTILGRTRLDRLVEVCQPGQSTECDSSVGKAHSH